MSCVFVVTLKGYFYALGGTFCLVFSVGCGEALANLVCERILRKNLVDLSKTAIFMEFC